MIGWANVSRLGARVEVEAGFREAKPKGKAFRDAFAAEVERMNEFLRLEEE
jgi:hypothetical protein